jgi:hypothetical protein
VDARLLSGYVRFASVRTGAPNGADAERPQGPADPAELQLDVIVQQTEPMMQVVECAERRADGHVAYFCAVPVGALRAWSGRSLIRTSDPSTLAATVDERSSARRRVCRYTTHLGHDTVPAQMSNEGHPLQYVAVPRALPNQNFLVVRAGDDTQAFDCPNDDDGSGSAQLSGRTHRHQPAV